MSIIEAPRNNSSDVSHPRHLEVPGVLHLVELRVRSGQAGLEEFHSRLLAVATLHGSIFKHGIQLWGYNIFADRALLVLLPARPHAFSAALTNAEHRFVHRFDEVHRQVASFWERGYFACPVADEVAWRVLRYVDRLSVPEDGDPLDPRALNSAAEHAGLVKRGLLTAPPERLPDPMAWRAFLFAHEDEHFTEALELCLRTGKPFGPQSFVDKIEQACGHRVGSSCLRWPRLFDNGRPAPYSNGGSCLMQCRSGA